MGDRSRWGTGPDGPIKEIDMVISQKDVEFIREFKPKDMSYKELVKEIESDINFIKSFDDNKDSDQVIWSKIKISYQSVRNSF